MKRPNDCRSEEHCINARSEDAIHMVGLPTEGDPSIGRWRWLSDMKSKSEISPTFSLVTHNWK
jgi:hypothetical protein